MAFLSAWRPAVSLSLVLLGASGSLAGAAAEAAAADPGWPRTIEKGDLKLVYYQPQIESWKDYKLLAARVAFTVTKAGKQAVGVVKIQAETLTDTETRTVVIQKITATEVHFPSLDSAAEERARQRFSEVFPTAGMTVSLDRILAALEKTTAPAAKLQTNDDPPPIFVSEKPAILLFVDGEPVYAPIEGTGLKFVVNTNWDLFYNEATSHYYLLDEDVWRTAQALEGPWEVTRTLPADMAKLPSGQNFDDVKKMVPPPAVQAKPVKVFFTSKPAEILVFDGKPAWVDIPKTKLAYAKNVEADVFLKVDAPEYYYLISGRWFRAKSLEGPWTFASNDLPADFRAIPPRGPKGDVLASVPGTEQAIDAVLLARIPTTVVVNKAEAEKAVKVSYDGGESKFAPIPETSMSYATNTQDKVLKVGDLYYLCFQGVWFMSTTPNGPWKTCDSVPKEIYTIPASSPVYNVTYVTVSDPTTTTVEASYTSGYTGAFVVGMSVGACVVYGTGWYYPPYFWYPPYYAYPIYRPYPYAYGYGAWYNTATGRYGYGGAVYGPYGAAGGAAWYNPSTGRYGRAATVQTPWGGRTYSSSYNPYTGVASARAGGWSPYGSWGSSAVQRGDDWAVSNRVSNSQGTVRHTYTSEGGSMTKVRTDQGTVRVGQDANNNVYAGKDGNVYKKDASGSWSKYENGSWNAVDKPQGSGSTREARASASSSGSRSSTLSSSSAGSSWSGSDVSRDLNREASSRSTGSQRAQSWSSATRSGGGYSRGGGGATRGGGGGRRR